VGLLALASPHLAGAQEGDGGGMEVFEAVDPYTQGAPEALERLGYVTLGPFPWMGADNTRAAQEKLGGSPMLWVETAHFKIGSSLTTYTLLGDRAEKTRVEGELERLRERLGKLKAQKRKLDPWLRLHLFAQRAEELYGGFLDDFGLEPADFADSGPHLGQPHKFLLLVCQRQSEYTRFASTYAGVESDSMHRFGSAETGMGFAINAEVLQSYMVEAEDAPLDTMLFCYVASGLANQFIDGYRRADYGSPFWLQAAYGHLAARRIDPRYVSGAGYVEGQEIREDDHDWAPRVAGLVRNEFFASADVMFGWEEESALSPRDHLVAWSKLEFLLEGAQGSAKGFLRSVARPAPGPQGKAPPQGEAQRSALLEHFGTTPAEFDKAWSEWVLKTYKKR
jgi:hypothetical protein